jgi:RecJ-like exonuclease
VVRRKARQSVFARCTGVKPEPNISHVRALLLIFALLPSFFRVSADDVPVIKDSEATQYVGRKVEVRGLVVSVTTSPLGTSFINFGQEYPSQIFAGFIAAGSKMANDQRLTTLQGKVISIVGTIQIDQGKPEIEVISADQIKGATALAEPK